MSAEETAKVNSPGEFAGLQSRSWPRSARRVFCAIQMGYFVGVLPLQVRADLEGCIAALRGVLDRFGYERAILFGSAARGDVHEGSDLDVIVVKRTNLPFIERPRALLEMLPSGLAVDVLVYTPEEFEWLSRDPRGVLASALTEGVEL